MIVSEQFKWKCCHFRGESKNKLNKYHLLKGWSYQIAGILSPKGDSLDA